MILQWCAYSMFVYVIGRCYRLVNFAVCKASTVGMFHDFTVLGWGGDLVNLNQMLSLLGFEAASRMACAP